MDLLHWYIVPLCETDAEAENHPACWVPGCDPGGGIITHWAKPEHLVRIIDERDPGNMTMLLGMPEEETPTPPGWLKITTQGARNHFKNVSGRDATEKEIPNVD